MLKRTQYLKVCTVKFKNSYFNITLLIFKCLALSYFLLLKKLFNLFSNMT